MATQLDRYRKACELVQDIVDTAVAETKGGVPTLTIEQTLDFAGRILALSTRDRSQPASKPAGKRKPRVNGAEAASEVGR